MGFRCYLLARLALPTYSARLRPRAQHSLRRVRPIVFVVVVVDAGARAILDANNVGRSGGSRWVNSQSHMHALARSADRRDQMGAAYLTCSKYTGRTHPIKLLPMFVVLGGGGSGRLVVVASAGLDCGAKKTFNFQLEMISRPG